jgi:hypothetical protein
VDVTLRRPRATTLKLAGGTSAITAGLVYGPLRCAWSARRRLESPPLAAVEPAYPAARPAVIPPCTPLRMFLPSEQIGPSPSTRRCLLYRRAFIAGTGHLPWQRLPRARKRTSLLLARRPRQPAALLSNHKSRLRRNRHVLRTCSPACYPKVPGRQTLRETAWVRDGAGDIGGGRSTARAGRAPFPR